MPQSYAIQIVEHGSPEVLRRVEIEPRAPGPGEVMLAVSAAGLNFIDTYHRTGLYPVKLPFIPGSEAAGVVEAVGEGVTHLKVGDRAAYLGPGAYASHITAPAARMVALPDDVGSKAAAATMLKGLTAWMLLFEIRPVRPGETALVWAPVGGVGSLLVPWAVSMGVEVIAVTSSAEKAERARALGAQHVVMRDGDVAGEVRALTGGRGVEVSYDSVGRASAEATLGALAPRGWWVSYGNASGPVEPVPPGRLNQAGSLVLTRPGLFHFIAERADFERGCQALFGALKVGPLKAEIGARYALDEVGEAHRALEAGQTMGATLLTP